MEFRRLKVHVVLIIFAVVLMLGLLGQYFLHQKQVLEPMMAQVAGVDGVQEATLSRRKQKTVVSVFLDDDADLAETMAAVQHVLYSYGKEFALELLDDPSPTSLRAFQKMMFVLEEAVIQGNFREMETQLSQIADEFGQEMVLSLDRSYIYVQLKDGAGQLSRVISRGESAGVNTVDVSEVKS